MEHRWKTIDSSSASLLGMAACAEAWSPWIGEARHLTSRAPTERVNISRRNYNFVFESLDTTHLKTIRNSINRKISTGKNNILKKIYQLNIKFIQQRWPQETKTSKLKKDMMSFRLYFVVSNSMSRIFNKNFFYSYLRRWSSVSRWMNP